MNLSTEETLMYKVMKAIYDSGVPVNFKGSLVLKACLEDAGYLENTRHTVDIDANWYSDKPPTGQQMVDSLQKAMDRSVIPLLVYLNRMHGERRSAGFTLYDKDSLEELFTMDIDVNRPMSQTKIYEIIGIRFRGVIPVYIIADKVFVISTNKVFRRIKDVIDLFLSGARYSL